MRACRWPILGLAWWLGFAANSALASPIELPQADGSTLVLEQPARRLVTLAPHLAELVYTAGAGEALLATVEYSDYPPAAAALPRIGDAFRFDMESILALAPDLVLVWHSGNPLPAQQKLRDLGLTPWLIEIRNPEDLAHTIETIGRATGQTETAGAAAQSVRETLIRLERTFQGRSPVTYFYQVAQQPLYTVNGEHLISQALALCGARNVFHDLPQLAPQVGREAVMDADPDVLLTGRLDPADDPLSPWREWPQLKAVANGALLAVDANRINRATPRMLESVENACNLMDPFRP